MTPGQASGLVHGPLRDWAHSRPQAIAIRNGAHGLTFAELHAAVTQRADQLIQSRAPGTVFIDPALGLTQRLVDFLGIVSSGRCAAVTDPDWPPAVRAHMQAILPAEACSLPEPQATTPFYVGFTSGSTGKPKGFRRHHRSWVESFKACIQTFGPDAAACVLAPGRDSHSLFLFGMLLGLWTGAGTVVQERFSAAATLDTLRQGLAPGLVAVPSQLVLLLELARHRGLAPMPGVRLIMISGARWMRHRTEELRALFPEARVIEFYGASETSFIAWMDSDAHAPAHAVGYPFANVQLQVRKDSHGNNANDASDARGTGLLFVRSPMLFTDYVGIATQDADATAAIRDGEWLSVRDLGYLDAEGRLCLVGRQSRMIVTQGKNLFAEELEAVLTSHPAIAAASVHGLDDARRGALVVAIIQWRSGDAAARPATPDLKAWCRERLEAFKVPRKVFVCSEWPATAGGKTDHTALALLLHRHLDMEDTACLTPLP
jgi:long-chain acyl-CoA synthetase